AAARDATRTGPATRPPAWRRPGAPARPRPVPPPPAATRRGAPARASLRGTLPRVGTHGQTDLDWIRRHEGRLRPHHRLPAHLGHRPLQPALGLLHALARAGRAA